MFTTTVLLGDLAVIVPCVVIRQIYRPGSNLVLPGAHRRPRRWVFDRALIFFFRPICLRWLP